MKPRFFLFAAALAFAAVNFAGCEKDNEKPNGGVDTTKAKNTQIGSPFDKPVIDKILPTDKSTSVGVFERPQVVFNVRVNVDTMIKKSVFRISIAELTLSKNDGTKTEGNYSVSRDNLMLVYNLKEPYENGTSYKLFVKVRFEQMVDSVWQAVKDENDNDYFEEQTTEFTAGNRPFTFNPEHVLYAYPADRQFNFLPKEANEAYLILDFDYTFLFNEYKSKGYEQKIRITPFGGETTTVDFTYKTLTNGSGSAEIDCPIDKLNLANNVICHLALVNIAKDSSAIDASVPYEIYAIDFRTSSYNTISEKMINFNIEKGFAYQIRGTVFQLLYNFTDTSSIVEIFDDYEYNYDKRDRCLLRLNVDYDNCEWYKDKIAPLIYENADVISIVGEGTYMPPKYMYAIGLVEDNTLLCDEEVKTGVVKERDKLGAFNFNAPYFINNDFDEIFNILANYKKEPLGRGAEDLLNTDYFPYLIEGNYPMKLEYVLPGKNSVTTTLSIDMPFSYE